MKHTERITTLLFFAILAFLGSAIAWSRSQVAFGDGDIALFHTFTKWILDGDVFIRDFVHFRTPGPHYFRAALQSVVGFNFRTTAFAILLESYLFQVIANFFLGLVAARSILGRHSPWIGFSTAIVLFFLPPIFQLRTALPEFVIALYMISHWNNSSRSNWTLAASGAALGLCFWFGQEVFIFLGWAIACVEIIALNNAWKWKLKRSVILCVSAAIIVVAGILWMAAHGASIKEFLYYSLYYAFFVQPKGMDLPFPTLHRATVQFYAYFWILLAGAAIFSLSGRLKQPAVALLISFAGLRMISALGRADLLHLYFSVSETIVVLAIACALLPFIQFTRHRVRIASVSVLLSGMIFFIGMRGHSSALLLTPAVFCLMARIDSREPETPIRVPTSVTFLAGAVTIALLYYGSLPASRNWAHYLSLRPAPLAARSDNVMQGVALPPELAEQSKLVQSIIEKNHAETIFSYPIHPLYYAFAKHHATRFASFEPQTTATEFAEAEEDLRKSKPELVFKDLDQAAGYSYFLYPLSDAINALYKPAFVVPGAIKLQVFVRRTSEVAERRLFDRTYAENKDHVAVTDGTRTFGGSETPVIAVNKGVAVFELEPGRERFLVSQLFDEPGGSPFGVVEIKRGDQTMTTQVKLADGQVKIPLPKSDGPIEIKLRAGDPGKYILWIDPYITDQDQ